MAVSFTPNIGLAKPDETELAANWARFTDLADDNNVAINAAAALTLTNYVPVLTSSGTAPSIGAGVATGQYQNLNGFILGNACIPFIDPGVSVGTGNYGISLPVLADATFHTINAGIGSALTNSVIGEGYTWDNSTGNTSGTVAVDIVSSGGVHYGRMIPEAYTTPTKTSKLVSANLPFTAVDQDFFVINFFYKAA